MHYSSRYYVDEGCSAGLRTRRRSAPPGAGTTLPSR
jgi:hypothetical protein